MNLRATLGAATLLLAIAIARPCATAAADVAPIPHNAQTAVVQRYLTALRDAKYAAAYALLDDAERTYYRNAQNYRSIYLADAYRVTAFRLRGARGNDTIGRVYFARETATYRDYGHDVDLALTATVPVGVIPQHGGWRIKDPGHPWRAFAATASSTVDGVRVTVKKMSFFARRIESVVTFENDGDGFVTILAYGKSMLRDAAGHVYAPIATRDWSLTDKVLFEGLHLAPHARYTGMLAFACEPAAGSARAFSLTIAPLLADGGDQPFAIDIAAIAGG